METTGLMRITLLAIWMLYSILAVQAGDLSGTYMNETVSLSLEADGDSAYTGTVRLGDGDPMALTAVPQAEDAVNGTFSFGGVEFTFSARLQEGGDLLYQTGNTSMVLSRQDDQTPGSPSNPFDTLPADHAGNQESEQREPDPPVAPEVDPLTELDSLNLGKVREDRDRVWTLLLYIAADNNLETNGVDDINELEAGFPEEGVEIIVFIDRAEGYDNTNGDWKDARIFRIRKDDDPENIRSEQLAYLGETNTGNARVLENFLKESLRCFPSRYAGLIMWDHGNGWSGMAHDNAAPSSVDGHDLLELDELSRALDNALSATDDRGKLDLIGFDMCLMAQIEVAEAVAEHAEVMLASQAVEDVDGWPYNLVLPAFSDRTFGVRRLAGNIIEGFRTYYLQKENTLAPLSTLSAIDLSMLPGVLDEFRQNVEAMREDMELGWSSLSRAIFFSESFTGSTDLDDLQQRDTNAVASFDMLACLALYNELRGVSPTNDTFRDLIDATDRMIINSWAGPNRKSARGISFYAPIRAAQFAEAYRRLSFARETGWDTLLTELHTRQRDDETPLTITNFDLRDADGNTIDAIPAMDASHLHFDVDGKNILMTEGRELVPLTGQEDWFAISGKWILMDPDFYQEVQSGRREFSSSTLRNISPPYVDGVNPLSIELTGLKFGITDGRTVCHPTFDFRDIDSDYATVPIIYSEPSIGEIQGQLLIDKRWWKATGMVFFVDGQVFELPIQPGGTITPLAEVRDVDGNLDIIPTGELSTDYPITYSASFVGEGQLIVQLIAENLAGRRTTAFHALQSAPLDPELADMVSRGRFQLGELEGPWEVHHPVLNSDNITSAPSGYEGRFTASPDMPGSLLYTFTVNGEENDLVGIAELHDAEECILKIAYFNTRNEYSHTELYWCAKADNPELGPVIIARNLNMGPAGIRYLMRPAGYHGQDNSTGSNETSGGYAASGSMSGGGPSHAEQQATVAPGNTAQALLGSWVSMADNSVVTLSGNQWQQSMHNVIQDGGVFEVANGIVYLQSQYSGQVYSFYFAVNGNILTAVNATTGEQLTLQKIQ